MKKISMLASILVLLSVGVFLGYKNYSTVDNVNANPDYICKKAVTNQPCIVTSCDPWSPTGTRTCYGTKTTEVSYYLIRTSCESGYTKVSAGGNVGGSSGRQGSDYVSGSTSCTITESDTIPPTGEIN